MKTLTTTLVLSSLLFLIPITVMAGSGHEHGHSHAPAAPVNQLTAEKNKVDNSWSTIKASSVEQKLLNGRSEWLVIYDNEKITELDKKKLYVFLTIEGEYIAANYTGK